MVTSLSGGWGLKTYGVTDAPKWVTAGSGFSFNEMMIAINTQLGNLNTAIGQKITNSAGVITESLLGSGAVTENKIGAGAVTSGKIGALQVTSGLIANYAITNNKIATNAVHENAISGRVVTSGKIAVGAVLTEHIAPYQITSGTIANGAVVAGKLGTGVVSGTHIVDNSIDVNHFQNFARNIGSPSSNSNATLASGATLGTNETSPYLSISNEPILLIAVSNGYTSATGASRQMHTSVQYASAATSGGLSTATWYDIATSIVSDDMLTATEYKKRQAIGFYPTTAGTWYKFRGAVTVTGAGTINAGISLVPIVLAG